jgi:hypothetical protein
MNLTDIEMRNKNRVGEVVTYSGNDVYSRAGKLGDTIVSTLHGRYTESTLNRRVFHGANQAAVAQTAGLATTWTGLSLTNPANSTVYLALLNFGFAIVTVQATAGSAIGLMTSDTTGLASAVTGYNGLDGWGATSQGILDNGGTIATPILQMVFGATSTGAITTVMMNPGFIELDGQIVLPPGRSVLTYNSIASTAAQWFYSFTWEEIPI